MQRKMEMKINTKSNEIKVKIKNKYNRDRNIMKINQKNKKL